MGQIILATEEYLNGFRRYIPARCGVGRPVKEDKISYLDYPKPICELPPVGEKIYIFDTVLKRQRTSTEKLLYDVFETDCYGHPIVLKVKGIINEKVYLEQTIETFNGTYVHEKHIPCTWFTSGNTGWVSIQTFYERVKQSQCTTYYKEDA